MAQGASVGPGRRAGSGRDAGVPGASTWARVRLTTLQPAVALLVVAFVQGCRLNEAGPNGVASVVIRPGTVDVRAGAAISLAVTLRNAGGYAVNGRSVTWRSANPLVAEVSPAGVVTGRTTGTTRITAIAERVEGSAQIVVVPGPAVALAFTAPPTTTVVREVIAPAVRVAAQDAMGNVATDFGGSITVALGANPGGGTLAGVTTAAAVAGVATFPSLSLNKIGAGYTLTAQTSGLTAATSPGFVIAPGPAATLEFTVAPRDTTAGAVFSPAIQITARDTMGNIATGFAGTVTIAIGTNPGSGTLSGTTAVSAVTGVATFPLLSIDRVGVGYTLTASASGTAGATSPGFSIRPGTATQLAFTVQPGTTTAGSVIARRG